jgi:sialidase-1
VFSAGESNYSCIRVPTVIQTRSGELLVAAEARISSCGDQAPKDVVLKRSVDNGRTWSALERIVGSHTGNFTFRNPYLVESRQKAKTVILNYVNSTVQEPWNSYQRISTDGGHTWEAQTYVS